MAVEGRKHKLTDALHSLYPMNAADICFWVDRDNTVAGLEWITENAGDRVKPTQAEVDTEIARLDQDKALELLRAERDKRIAVTDWTQNPDVPSATSNKWKAYRQALRDIPDTAFPKLNDWGMLDDASVTWPTEP